VCTLIGDTEAAGHTITDIAFDDTGALWDITGNGGTDSQSLVAIDKSTGAVSFKLFVGVPGSGGLALAFNPDDGLLYTLQGQGTPNEDELLDTIHPTTLIMTNVPLSGFDYDGVHSMTYDADAGNLIFGDQSYPPARMRRVTPAGVVSLVGDMDHYGPRFGSRSLSILNRATVASKVPDMVPENNTDQEHTRLKPVAVGGIVEPFNPLALLQPLKVKGWFLLALMVAVGAVAAATLKRRAA
jgi:hypothetical protein